MLVTARGEAKSLSFYDVAYPNNYTKKRERRTLYFLEDF
jgi:hypothetical protein